MTAVSICALLAACSDGGTAARANSDERPDQAGCIDEFVQEFEETAEDPARETPTGICFAENSPPDGPPKFPAMSRKVRVEYQRGDYFVTQEAASWTFDEPDTARNCMVARLVKVRTVAISEDGGGESVRIENGTTQRSPDTGDEYRASIRLGSFVPGGDVVPGYRISRETTSFGPDCIRAAQEGGSNSSTCSFEQPHRCRSVKVMLPAESRVPNASGGVQVGRTTSFRSGAVVDRSSWVLP